MSKVCGKNVSYAGDILNPGPLSYEPIHCDAID